MALELECLQKLADNLQLDEEPKVEKQYQHKKQMVRLESLKKSNQFKRVLKEKKVHSKYFSIFASKNFYKPKYKNDLLISFVMKKKIGNAVKRNKIRRKLKAIVQKLLKKRGAISKDYTYIVFGKTKAYTGNHNILLSEMNKVLKKIK